MFASAVSVEGAEDISLPLPPPVPEVSRQHAKAAALLPYQFYRRLRPRQLDHLQKEMTSYQFMLQMDRGTISDFDDDCNPRFTIFADRVENEYNAISRKNAMCKETPTALWFCQSVSCANIMCMVNQAPTTK
eukprot:3999870-Amphidinium_carterae.1